MSYQWRIVWSRRNEEVPGHDAATRASAERAATDRDLREVYDQRHHLEPHVASLLHQDEHEHRSRSQATNKNWLLFAAAFVALKSVQLMGCSRYGRILRQYRVTSRGTVMSGKSEATATVVVSDRVGRTSFSSEVAAAR
jgi:hypothetical protein